MEYMQDNIYICKKLKQHICEFRQCLEAGYYTGI